MYQFLVFLASVHIVQAQQQCTKAGTAFCSEDQNGLTSGPIILRCLVATGSPQPGNCNNNLANVPPSGVKNGALCWQSSPTAGDAQCTYNCVMVTAANGTTLYPLGCNRAGSSSSSLLPSSPVSSQSSGASTVIGSSMVSTATSGDSGSTSSSLRSFGQTSTTATGSNTQPSAQATSSTSTRNAGMAMAPDSDNSVIMGVLGLLLAIF